jgi:Spy/CpxP family protein refolding chaperone
MANDMQNELKRISGQLLTASGMAASDERLHIQLKSAYGGIQKIRLQMLQKELGLTDDQREAITKFFK